MKILFSYQSQFMLTLVQSLARSGHSVDILTPLWLGNLALEKLDQFTLIPCENFPDYLKQLNQALDSKKYDYFFPSWVDTFSYESAVACERNGLPTIPSEAARYFNTKHAYYGLFEELGIPYPKIYAMIEPDTGLDAVPPGTEFPCLAKPGHAISAPGMKILNTPEELLEFFSEKTRRTDPQYFPRGEPYMITKFIQGTTYSIMGHTKNGHSRIDFAYDIESDSAPYTSETGTISPSKHNVDECIPYIEKMFQHLGIDNTIWMFDVSVDQAGNIYFIDFGNRAPMNPQQLVKYRGEEDYATKVIDCLFHDRPLVLDVPRAAIFRQIKLQPGLLKSLTCSRPELAEKINLPQDAVWSATNDYEVYRNPNALIVADTLEEAEQKWDQLIQSISVEYKTIFKDRYAEIFWKKKLSDNAHK